MTQCPICLAHHNHFSCPYCGAVKVNRQTFDIANGMILVARAIPAPRELRLAVSKQVVRRMYARLIAKM